ncbi:MAG: hypothetical protein IJ496_05620 [Ruminococcus sp.]|nr:hypothetical protein [Ruminococcus sp.]
MENFKYISQNTIQHLSLHDCVCANLFYKDSSLIFEMEWMEVLSAHPDNPFDQAHQSGCGRIVLFRPIINHGSLDKWKSNESKTIMLSEHKEIKNFEILEFNEEKDKNGFVLSLYGVFSSDPQFDSIEMKIMYSSSKVMFNNLNAVSWFESPEF